MDKIERFKQLCDFYANHGGKDLPVLICGDASNRKFYRVPDGILMDAPNETEKNNEFVDIANRLAKAKISAPVIKEVDLNSGFLLVSDLGTVSFADLLEEAHGNDEAVYKLYSKAIDLMVKLNAVDTTGLPVYDRAFIKREDDICRDYYFPESGQEYTSADEDIVSQAEEIWSSSDLGFVSGAMHRDFHSRNIMSTRDGLALIDFQDMVMGPVVYDLVSLLRDCYYELSPALLERLLTYAYKQYDDYVFHGSLTQEQFERAFDFAGLQRHFKCLGIFNRLSKRDGKHGYLANIPLVEKYVINVADKYPELSDFVKVMKKHAKVI